MKFDPQALKAFRTGQHLTIEQLASKAGVTSSTVGRAERGEHIPEPSTVYALAGALEVPLMELFILEPEEAA